MQCALNYFVAFLDAEAAAASLGVGARSPHMCTLLSLPPDQVSCVQGIEGQSMVR